MNATRFSIGEAIGFGWDVAKRNVGFFFVLFLILAVVNGIPSAPQEATKETAPFIAFLFGLVSFAVGQITSIGLVLFGVVILGVLALVIGLFWAAPTTMVAAAFVYRKLLGETRPVPTPPGASALPA